MRWPYVLAIALGSVAGAAVVLAPLPTLAVGAATLTTVVALWPRPGER